MEREVKYNELVITRQYRITPIDLENLNSNLHQYCNCSNLFIPLTIEDLRDCIEGIPNELLDSNFPSYYKDIGYSDRTYRPYVKYAIGWCLEDRDNASVEWADIRDYENFF